MWSKKQTISCPASSDAATGSFKLAGDKNTNTDVRYSCRVAVKATDYIFTAYPKR
jgi:hypothetical protein